jgi:hypothetical protein
LEVTDAQDGGNSDHADWANPTLIPAQATVSSNNSTTTVAAPKVTITGPDGSGLVKVVGTETDDSVSMSLNNNWLQVGSTSIDLRGVTAIQVGLKGGNDYFALKYNSSYNPPIFVWLDGGDDKAEVWNGAGKSFGASGGSGYDRYALHDAVFLGIQDSFETFWTDVQVPSSGWGVNPAQSVIPQLTSQSYNRSADRLVRVFKQFNVESNPRYASTSTATYCNIFVWDVTSALGAMIPHWVYSDGHAAQPFAKGASELNANATSNWLDRYGNSNGWYLATPETAQSYADQGKPAIVIWKNPTGESGHMAIVRPDVSPYNASQGPAIAQAGRVNMELTHVMSSNSFGSRTNVRYFVHS